MHMAICIHVVRACMHAYVCMCACVHACVHACMCAYMENTILCIELQFALIKLVSVLIHEYNLVEAHSYIIDEQQIM